MADKPTPTDAELTTILCTHWPADSRIAIDALRARLEGKP